MGPWSARASLPDSPRMKGVSVSVRFATSSSWLIQPLLHGPQTSPTVRRKDRGDTDFPHHPVQRPRDMCDWIEVQADAAEPVSQDMSRGIYLGHYSYSYPKQLG